MTQPLWAWARSPARSRPWGDRPIEHVKVARGSEAAGRRRPVYAADSRSGCAHTIMRIADLQPGWDVLTNDGHRLGRVKETGQHFLEVSGGLFSAPLFVPASAIGNVEGETVHLTLARDQVDSMGWQQKPRTSDELHTSPERDVDRDI